MSDERAYDRTEAAAVVGVHPNAISRAINKTEGHRLRAKKVGNRIRIKHSDLWEWFDGLEDA